MSRFPDTKSRYVCECGFHTEDYWEFQDHKHKETK